MKKTMKYFMFLLVSTMVVFTSCKDDDEPNGGGGTAGNSAISELAVTPNADVKYGDEVTLTAKFADEKGFIDKTDISSLPFFHRMYFKLIKRNRPFLLTVCINIVRFWQRFFR